MADTLSAPDALQDFAAIIGLSRRNQMIDVTADHFRSRVSEDASRCVIPARDGSIELLPHDGIRGEFDDRSRAELRFPGNP